MLKPYLARVRASSEPMNEVILLSRKNIQKISTYQKLWPSGAMASLPWADYQRKASHEPYMIFASYYIR